MITKTATIDWVIDHWTVMCAIDLGLGVTLQKPVRLYGVCEPLQLTKKLLEKYVDCEVTLIISEDKSMRYGQLLATITCEGTNLNTLILEKKYAQPYKRD